LALAHRALPDSEVAAKADFAGRLRAMAGALAKVQGKDGMWRANLLFPSDPKCPNQESTSTGFFTFGLAYGVNAGILDKATYAPIVAAAWAGLAGISLQPSGLVGWCQPVGAGPAPATQNSTSEFCVGAFLLAGSEVYRAASA
jgi:unsaturated rhamnogalacturonyl hydrolase